MTIVPETDKKVTRRRRQSHYKTWTGKAGGVSGQVMVRLDGRDALVVWRRRGSMLITDFIRYCIRRYEEDNFGGMEGVDIMEGLVGIPDNGLRDRYGRMIGEEIGKKEIVGVKEEAGSKGEKEENKRGWCWGCYQIKNFKDGYCVVCGTEKGARLVREEEVEKELIKKGRKERRSEWED